MNLSLCDEFEPGPVKMVGFKAAFRRGAIGKQDLENATGNAHHTLIFAAPMPNSITERRKFQRASGGKRKNMALPRVFL